jgi:hypothetical protein
MTRNSKRRSLDDSAARWHTLFRCLGGLTTAQRLAMERSAPSMAGYQGSN